MRITAPASGTKVAWTGCGSRMSRLVFSARAGMNHWVSNTSPCGTRIPRYRGVLQCAVGVHTHRNKRQRALRFLVSLPYPARLPNTRMKEK